MKNASFLVTLAIIWVAILSAPVAAQDGVVNSDSTTSQGVVVGTYQGDEVVNDNYRPDNQAETIASEPGPQGPQGSQGQTGLSGKPGLRGHYGVRGLPGRNGQHGQRGLLGPAGKNANAVGIYRHIKTWDPASVSYVDARDNRTLQRAKDYTDGALSTTKKSVPVAPAIATTDKDKDWNWWWLLWPLLILFLLGFLLWLGQLGFWNWFTNLFQPKQAPAQPIMTNIAGCNAFGIDQDDAEIEVVSSGKSCVEIRKGVSFSPSGGWKWTMPNEKLTISSDVGTPAKFIVACHNKASMPIKTDLVFPKDTFVSHLSPAYRVTRGSFYLGSEKLGEMNQEDIEAITQGNSFPLSDYVDEIPAGGYFNFVYEVEIIGDGNNVPTPNGAAPAPSRYSVKEIMAEREKTEADRKAAEVKRAADAAKKSADEIKAEEDQKAADKAAEEAKKAKKDKTVTTTVQPVAPATPSAADLAAAAKKGTV